ncbi:MAG: type II toxin-antitoxin system HicA family toxin [candidate division SR1 bacterium]|nr:type II toxin-antitoxin system HicA family toxin [candidate division SR1 bacterium]
MPKIVPLKFKEVCDKLKRFGYQGPLAGGKHMHMYKGTQVVPVPKHGGKDVSKGVIESIIHQIGVSKDEWINL